MAIKLKPNSANYLTERGICYLILEDDDKAMLDFNKAITLKADYAKAYHYRAVTKKFKENVKGACEDFKKA